jgi:hypothetical protein
VANAIGKSADTIGVGVEALQELRFAAKASGVEQRTRTATEQHAAEIQKLNELLAAGAIDQAT